MFDRLACWGSNLSLMSVRVVDSCKIDRWLHRQICRSQRGWEVYNFLIKIWVLLCSNVAMLLDPMQGFAAYIHSNPSPNCWSYFLLNIWVSVIMVAEVLNLFCWFWNRDKKGVSVGINFGAVFHCLFSSSSIEMYLLVKVSIVITFL